MPEAKCIASWCKGEEWCAITCAADLIGKKWHPVIIHRLLDEEPMGFNELKREIDGISSKVLSDSLEDLEKNSLVNRKVVSEKPVKVEYSLTGIGESLEPVITELAEWGQEYLRKPEAVKPG